MQEISKRRPGRPPQNHVYEHEVRNKLIQAAIRQFSLNGFGSTTVRSIAEEAGVNVSLISYYFGSKEGIYRSAISQFGEERLAAARKVLVPQDTLEGVRDQLLDFLDELFACYVKSPELVKLIYRESDCCSPFIKEIFRDTFFEIFNTLVSFLDSAQKRELLNQDFIPQMAASMLFSGYSQAVRGDELSKELLGVSIVDPSYRNQFKKQIVSMVLFGLKSPWNSGKGEA